jgi:hypothetical protein
MYSLFLKCTEIGTFDGFDRWFNCFRKYSKYLTHFTVVQVFTIHDPTFNTPLA